MKCPKCNGEMIYLNQDYQSHGYYCMRPVNAARASSFLEVFCDGWVRCDKECCTSGKSPARSRWKRFIAWLKETFCTTPEV